jgi:hypothetical protein
MEENPYEAPKIPAPETKVAAPKPQATPRHRLKRYWYLALRLAVPAPALYFLSYFLLVQPIPGPPDRFGRTHHPKYRIGGKAVETFFQLAHDLDRDLRWRHWHDP